MMLSTSLRPLCCLIKGSFTGWKATHLKLPLCPITDILYTRNDQNPEVAPPMLREPCPPVHLNSFTLPGYRLLC